MQRIPRALICLLISLATAVMVRAEIIPTRLDQFVAVPNTPAVLQWTGANPSASVAYALYSYTGTTYATGQQTSAADGSLSLALNLPGGYYEIGFAGGTKRYGLVVAPLPATAVDPFFAVDGALSWLQSDAGTRNDFLNILQRVHIGTVRERLGWDAVNPSPGTYSFQADKNYDTLRASYVAHGLKVLELFYSTPAFMAPTTANPFPADFVLAADSCAALAQHWAAAWGSLEAWNEPDTGNYYYARDMPADQYAPVAKTFAFSLAAQSPQTLLGGGVLSAYNQTYLTQALDNGLLDQTDYLSFHDYSTATALEGTIGSFRATLSGRARAAIPLWITESGWSWAVGTDRPVLAGDQASALQITMKAIEARACGVARYFPFVFPFYVEGANNFGMMGQEGTPLRSMAAYTEAIVRLSGANYVGDLQGSPIKARIFSLGTNGYCIVFLNGQVSAGATFLPGRALTVSDAYGIDGRPLTVGGNGSIPIPDGLTYVILPAGSLTPSTINTGTTAMNLTAQAQQTLPARGPLSPLVLQYPIPGNVTVSKVGYQITTAQMANFPLSLSVTNLSTSSRTATLNILANGVTTPKTVTAPPRSKATVAANVVITSPDGTVRVTGSDDLGVAVSPMQLRFFAELSLSDYLALYPQNSRVNITPASQWVPQSAGNVVLSNGTPTTTLHMDLSFAAGVSDRWAYPQLTLAQPQNPSWAGLQYLLIRARSGQSSAVRLFLVESSGAFYFTANPIIPADGQYHTALIPLSALTVAGGHPADPDGKLDPDQITAIQIGMNSDTTTNTLDVSDYYIITTPAVGMTVEQSAGTALTNAASTIDFGSAVLQTNSTRTFVVRNTGTTTLTGLSASVTGTNAADFGVTTSPPSTIAGGGSGTFVVTFSPGQNDARTAVLHVASNTAGASSFDIHLTGFGYSITAAAQNVSAAGATLEGTFNPRGVATTIYFQYGTTTNYSSTTAAQDIGNGSSSVNLSTPLTGLTDSTTYHVRAVVVSGGVTTYGVDQTFTTPQSVPALPMWAWVTLGVILLIVSIRHLPSPR